MIEAQLKKIAAICAGFMFFVIGISFLLETEPDSKALAVNNQVENELQQSDNKGDNSGADKEFAGAGNSEQTSANEGIGYMVMSQGNPLVDNTRWQELSNIFAGNIQIILPAAQDGSVVTIDEDYVSNSLDISIDNSLYELQDMTAVQRIVDGKYYMGEHDETMTDDPVRKFSVKRTQSKQYADTYCTDIRIKLDSIYAYNMFTFDDVMCIDVINPRQLYENIIVLDAGHGGPDAGCSSTNHRYYEKDIVLDIVNRLKMKLDNTNIKVYYTRLDDTGLSLHKRVNVANELAADMFISIHCNYYDRYWVPGVNGAEALYSSVCKQHKDNSRKLAQSILDSLTDECGIRKRGIINRKRELHILRNSKVPSTIIEVGYMSDTKELKKLTTKKEVNKIAGGIYDGIIKAYKNIYEKDIQ